ncbi:PP2C family protein-serine/threonine phosphatase [Embleya scabrispora]|uniref:PP2C family protein-serine/threonine phosphatase n=1 Tax=Embleya scabrispora TaxID=159449 RepID=UPI001375023B|nr:PP2C family protein-serine/threonine phosphatase [Embleya scabrispora]
MEALGAFAGAARWVGEPLLLVDGAGRVRAVNAAATTLLGAGAAGRTLASLVLDPDADVGRCLRRWRSTAEPAPATLTFRSDGPLAGPRTCLGHRTSTGGEVVVRVAASGSATVEGRADERLRRLYALSAVLAAAVSLREVAQVVREDAPSLIGVRSASLGLHLHRLFPLREGGESAAADEPWFDLDEPGGPELPSSPRGLDSDARTDASSTAAAPDVLLLTLTGHRPEPLGILRLELEAALPADEAAHVEVMAGQIAQAVSRAGLYEHEHRLAQRLQHSLLPDLPRLPELTVAARYAAGADQVAVGGDWYDLFRLPRGRIGMAIGDVAGHGLTEATEMAQLRSVLRAAALRAGDSPQEVMAEVNAFVCTYLPERTATACYLVYDPARGLLRYTNAGHMPPLLLPPTGSPRLLPGRVPLLGLPGVAPEPCGEVTIETGSALLLYTDGLIERRGQSLDEGFAFLSALVADAHDMAPDMLCRLLVDARDGSWPDDRALMAVRFEVAGSGTSCARPDWGVRDTKGPGRVMPAVG